MASLTCYPTASGDDCEVYKQGATYPPSGSATVVTEQIQVGVSKGWETDHFATHVGLVRFDTSPLPDGAIITAATLRLCSSGGASDADGRVLNVDWYDPNNWPIDAADYSDAVSAGAGSLDVTSWPSYGNWAEIVLSGLSNISKTGYTGLRLGVSGGQPAGSNGLEFFTYDYGSLIPQLVVTYAPGGYQHKVLGCLPATIAKIMGVPTANVGKFCGV